MLKKAINKYRTIGVEKKSVIWYAVSNILQKGVVFLTTPVIARMLSTDEYGTYSVFLSWRDIFLIFATLNLFQGVFTKILVDNKDDQDRCTSTIQGLGWLTTAVFAAVYFLFSESINSVLGQNSLGMTLMILYFFFFPSFSLWCSKQRVNFKYKSMVIVTLVVALFTPLVSILLLYFTDMKEDAVILGSMIMYIVGGFFFSVLNIYRGRQLFNKKIWLFALKYNIPLIPHYLSLIVLAHSDRIMIDYFCDESKAGIYSIAYQISSMMNIVYIAINNSFVPRAYEMLKNGNIDKLRRESEKLLLFTGTMTICAIIVAPELVFLMGGDKYREAIYILPPVCTALYITYCYGFFNNVELYFSRTKKVMIASAVSAISNVLLNWICIPYFGYIAAGYTTFVSYALLAVMHYIFSRRIGLEKYGRDVYNWKSLVGIIMGVIICAVVIFALYSFIIIRYSLVCIIGFIAILNRKKIIELIKCK